jgi:L-iditol 2-dehydrogenase
MHGFHAPGEIHCGGHEGAGEVVAVDNSACVQVGDRVAVNPLSGCGVCDLCRCGDAIFCASRPPSMGHFAEYVKVQDFLCTPLPDDIPSDLGSLLGCALAPASSCLRSMSLTAADTLLITGLGPVGLGAVTWAKFTGAHVVAVDPVPWRRDRARQIGADLTLDPEEGVLDRLRELTAGRGVPVALDCSGRPSAERLCLDAAAVRGHVGFIGENPGTIEISPSNDFIRRALTLHSAWHMNLNDAPALLTLLRRFPPAALLISHRFPFDQAQEAFTTFASAEAAKVLLTP